MKRKKSPATKVTVLKALKGVLDPELNISIVDLGLVYSVEVKKEAVKILMTLTTIGCPLFSLIEQTFTTSCTQWAFGCKITLTFTFSLDDGKWQAAKVKLGII